MGLDMYLYKRTYVQNWDHMRPEELHEVTVKKCGEVVPHIKPERVAYVVEQVGYWRKANQIHRWFVEHVQDGEDECVPHYVSEEQLANLLDLVDEVLKNHDAAPDLLPSQAGFFFGDTGYDEWYFEDLEHTKKILLDVLAETNEYGVSFEYRSSW